MPISVASREEYLPPFGLAERTCAKIWASADQKEDIVERNILRGPLNRLRILDTVLMSSSDSAERRISDPVSPSVKPATRHPLPKVSGDTRPGIAQGGWRLVDLFASIAVGILIAVLAFPAINYAKSQTERMVRQMRMKEFGQSVGLYALLDGVPEDDVTLPSGVNLAASAWREIDQDRLRLLQVASGSSPIVDSSPDGPLPFFRTASDDPPLIGEQNGRMISIGLETVSPFPFGTSYSSLWVDAEKAVPVYNGTLVQPAYGQNVLFQDGRVYFRVLPLFQEE